MRILVLGTGYVGLVSGTCFAELGHDVICVDNDANKINSLRQGQIPFFEPGLPELVTKNIQSYKLKFSNTLDDLNNCDIVFLAVGTPPRENGQADLVYVYKAVEEIAQKMNKYLLIVTKSTVPVGTGKKIKKIIQKHYSGKFDIASCPEFLSEGTAVKDFMNPNRIVIGTENDEARQILLQIHEKLECPKVLANIETAEMIKYAANAFLATKISFINEIANVCESIGADIEKVREGIGHDKRIGHHFLNAGIGYGGSCFPKDVRALHHISGQNGYQFQLLRSVIEVNNHQRWLFYKKIKHVFPDLENKTIAIWGLSYKPNTDDIRESIALDLIEKLYDDGTKIKVYDPQAMQNAQKLLGARVNYCFSPEYCAEGADALIIMTEWDEFKNFDLLKLKSIMKQPIIFDGRNIYNKEQLQNLNFQYHSVGR